MAKRKIYAAANRFTLKDSLFLAAGIASFCVGLKGFLLPSHFLDGGVVGISLILSKITDIPFVLLFLVFNLPFMWLGRNTVSRLFAVKAFATIVVLSFTLWLIGDAPPLTRDPLLVAVFGGFFVGLGVGLAIRGGAVLDGTEVLALFLARRSSLTVGDFILVINILIFVAAIFVFNLEIALYAMLTYLCASRTVDYVVYGVEEFMSVQVFSERSAPLFKVMKKDMKLNVTVLNGQRGAPLSQGDKTHPISILHTVVTRLDLTRVLNTIQALDPEATIIYHPVTDMHRLGSSEHLPAALPLLPSNEELKHS